MNHDGIVLADAVDMSSVENIEIEDIITTAINSGVDLFIFPNHVQVNDNLKLNMNPEKFIQIVTDAVQNGKIKEYKIDNSYKKITDLKRRFLIDGNI